MTNIVGESCKRQEIIRDRQLNNIRKLEKQSLWVKLSLVQVKIKKTVFKRRGDIRWNFYFVFISNLIILFDSVLEVFLIYENNIGSTGQQRVEANTTLVLVCRLVGWERTHSTLKYSLNSQNVNLLPCWNRRGIYSVCLRDFQALWVFSCLAHTRLWVRRRLMDSPWYQQLVSTRCFDFVFYLYMMKFLLLITNDLSKEIKRSKLDQWNEISAKCRLQSIERWWMWRFDDYCFLFLPRRTHGRNNKFVTLPCRAFLIRVWY